MQFITHRDPVAPNAWSTALGATGDAVNNILGIYSNYKNQQLEKKRYEDEQARQQREFDLRKQEHERMLERQNTQDAILARQIEEEAAARGIPGKRPVTGTRTVDAAPDFQVDSNKPDAATPFGAAPDLRIGTSPLSSMLTDKFKLDLTQPTRTEVVTAPVERRTIAPIKIAGREIPGYTYDVKYRDELQAEQEAAQHRKSMDIPFANISPEHRTILQKMAPASYGLYEAQGWIPSSVLDNIVNAETKPKKTEGFEMGGDWYVPDAQGIPQLVRRGYHAPVGGGSKETSKPLLASEISKVQDFRSGLAQLSNLLDEAKGTGTLEWAKTKIPNIMTEAFGWGEDAKSRQAALDTAKQIVGKAMEGGVLRKEDEIKYLKILPNIKDAPEVARDKIQRLVELMIRDSDLYVKTLAAAGRDVSDIKGVVDQSAKEAMVATGQIRPEDPEVEARRRLILGGRDRTLGAPQTNALGLPRVHVTHPPATRR